MKSRIFNLSLAFIYFFSLSCSEKKEREWTPVKVDKVLVYKSERKMHLIKKGEIVRSYDISLGDNPVGHKVKEGDERTPEGLYKLDWRNAQSSCYKSMHISYPNKQDKEKARKLKVSPGGDIMVHGLYPAIKWMGKQHVLHDWTNGCIGITNEEMDEFWACVKNGTTIEIKK